MSVICSTSCGVRQDVPAVYGDCELITREWGWAIPILFKCDDTWTDILDTAASGEWAAKLTGGEVGVLPKGTITWNAPSVTTIIVDGEGSELALPLEYVLDFATIRTAEPLANGSIPDYEYMAEIYANRDDYKLSFIDKNGHLLVDDAWVAQVTGGAPATVAGESPGFDFSFTAPPNPQPNETFFQWNMQFKIKKSTVFRAVFIDGLYALFN